MRWIMIEPGADTEALKARLQALGQWAKPLEGDGARGFALGPDSAHASEATLAALPGVAAIMSPPSPHPRIDAHAGADPLARGDGPPLLLAGPCAAEGPEQVNEAARMVAEAGGSWLRGGADKPRTSPYSFTGHGDDALRWLRDAADEHGLKLVTEAMSEHRVEAIAEVADMLQVGSRNMQNFALLREVGRAARPVLLKRGMAATVGEWLLAGEHLLAAGARHVVFCERGIRSFDTQTRNLLDLSAVALLKQVHRQPVIVDPSHAAGRPDLIPALSRAALAAGADGLLVEVHPRPGEARSDGPQALASTAALRELFETAPGARP